MMNEGQIKQAFNQQEVRMDGLQMQIDNLKNGLKDMSGVIVNLNILAGQQMSIINTMKEKGLITDDEIKEQIRKDAASLHQAKQDKSAKGSADGPVRSEESGSDEGSG